MQSVLQFPSPIAYPFLIHMSFIGILTLSSHQTILPSNNDAVEQFRSALTQSMERHVGLDVVMFCNTPSITLLPAKQ